MKITHVKAISILKQYDKKETGWENPADFGKHKTAKVKVAFPNRSGKKVIYVDASKTGKSVVGPTEWQGVIVTKASLSIPFTIDTEMVYKSGLNDIGHNNSAEFIAIVDALRLYEHYEWDTVYSDSKTAVSWVVKKKTNIDPSIRSRFSPDFLSRLEEAEDWLKTI